MPKFEIVYWNEDEDELEVTIMADDAAAALGVLLDETDNIAAGSPFAIVEVLGRKKAPQAAAARRKRAANGKGKGKGKTTEPQPVAVAAAPPIEALPLIVTASQEQEARAELQRICGSLGCELEV